MKVRKLIGWLISKILYEKNHSVFLENNKSFSGDVYSGLHN